MLQNITSFHLDFHLGCYSLCSLNTYICIKQIQKHVQWRISQYNLWQNASTADFNNLAKLQKQVQQAGRQAAVKVLQYMA